MSSFSCPVPPLPAYRVNVWLQPNPETFSWDNANKSVAISEKDFDRLAEYSTTMPTGVYPGKMWKAALHEGWHLRWFGIVLNPDGSEDLTKCSNHAYKLRVETEPGAMLAHTKETL